MEYLRLFQTETEYTAASSSLVLPNVSLTEDDKTVHFNTAKPSVETVDLGLPSGTK